MQGFILGLANGTTCLAYCTPVLVPLLLSGGKKIPQNGLLVAQFLGGRLVGYLLFGLLAWLAGRLLVDVSAWKEMLVGAATITLAILMAGTALLNHRAPKADPSCNIASKDFREFLRPLGIFIPAALGFLTGLNLCPPFLLAFTGAAASGSLLQSMAFFAFFFLGTSLYFIPLPFLGALRRHQALQSIGKMASVLIALYYLVSGIISIYGGIQIL